MDQKQLFRHKINLLKVTIPAEYRNMLDNIEGTFEAAIREERKISLDYWSDIVGGKEKYIVLPEMEKGKAYKLCAIISDIPPDSFVTYCENPPK